MQYCRRGTARTAGMGARRGAGAASFTAAAAYTQPAAAHKPTRDALPMVVHSLTLKKMLCAECTTLATRRAIAERQITPGTPRP